MELKIYEKDLHADILSDKAIIKKGIRKIYYVSSGRNAWHSTWVKQYNPGCMHSTLQSAKNYAEKLRTNGSVFYIQELPALVLEGELTSLIVTQINCMDVLQDYKPKIKPPNNKSTCCYITAGNSLLHACKSFDHDSIFWKTAPPAKNSVIRLLCTIKIKDFDPYHASNISAYKSESIGPDYLLNWSASVFEMKNKSLVKINNSRHRFNKEIISKHDMNFENLFLKLAKTNWTPHHASKYIANWPGLEGQLNLAWVLAGRPSKIDRAFLHGPDWRKAYELGNQQVENIPLREYATLFNQQDFYNYTLPHMQLIEKFVAFPEWERMFKASAKQ